MKNKFQRFPLVFACMMLFLTLVWMILIPYRSVLSFQQKDLTLSLETSYGRERKQQHEYEEVTVKLPETEKVEPVQKEKAKSSAANEQKDEPKAKQKADPKPKAKAG